LTVTSVGPFVGNHGDPESSSPAFTGLIDYFFNSASPIIPEDGGDKTPPAIIDNTPTGNNVPVNTQIHVTFSEAMDQASAESAFSMSPETGGSFSWNGNIMTYTPYSDLTFDTTYTVTIGTGVMDLADNNLQTEHIWQFITAVSDITHPTVTVNEPTETNVPVSTQIHVTFSEVMDQASAESAFSMSPETGGSFSWNGNIMTYTPDSDLTTETTYTVTISTDAMDLADNNMETDHIWQFTTAASDTTHPTVTMNEPTGTNIPVSTQINATFSEAMDQASAESAFSTSPTTMGSFSWNGNIMTYTPDSELTFDTTYTVTIDTGAMDLADNNMQTENTWQFTTEDVPEDVPASTNLIQNPGFESGTSPWLFHTSGTGTFSVVSPGFEGNNAAKLALNSGGTNIQLYQTGVTLEPDAHYRLSFAGYSTTGHDVNVRLFKHVSPYTNYGLDFTADLGTNWQTFTTEFTTTGFTGTVNDGRLQFWLAPFAVSGDTYYIDDIRLEKVEIQDITHPTVTGNEPTGTNVPVSAQINATFSEPMDKASAELAFSTSPITGGSFSWNGNIMTYTPDSDLTFDTIYTVTIGTDAKDLADNNIQTEYIWQFTSATYTIDDTEPELILKLITKGNISTLYINSSEPLSNCTVNYERCLNSSSKNWSETLNNSGEYNIIATDLAGNEALRNLTLEIGKIGPTINNQTNYTTGNVTLNITTTLNVSQESNITICEYDENPVGSVETTTVSLLGINKFVQIEVDPHLNDSIGTVRISINYSGANLTKIDVDSLKLHVWNDSIKKWEELEPSGIDKVKTIVWGELNHLSLFSILGEETDEYVPLGDDDNGGSSSSSGGGSSGEQYENIACSEIDRQYVYQNSDISYSFEMECNIVQYVNFTGLTNAGKIATKVEMLKDTSTLVDNPPSDIVYENLNIWVGNAGWATKSNIADATVVFIVERSWITENNIDESSIALYRYSDDTWHELVTRKIAEDANNLQFESETPGFSQFAVTGKKLEGEPGGESIFVEPTVTIKKTPAPTPTEKKGTPGFGIFAGFSVLLIAMQLLRKKN